ncbi:hypothetical protein HDK77DRAFT_480963 [Phyllosticta capitalensis]|uniref:Glutaredoxin-like protein n=1 Tax=Phyllosticta capitalensis TaxID=121624 RepID=A0ABR1YX18_9PEZI
MRATPSLLQRICRITFFYRQNCALCDNAKQTLSNVWDKRPFHYTEIDVMSAGQQKWKDVYEFDTPVIHVEKNPAKEGQETTTAARKLMHRFKEDQVEALMDEAEKDLGQ